MTNLNYQGLFVFQISFSPVLKPPTLFPSLKYSIIFRSYKKKRKTVILPNHQQDLPHTPSVPHLQVGSLEQNLRQGAEHVTDVEGAVVSMGKQLATVKQVGSTRRNGRIERWRSWEVQPGSRFGNYWK